MYEINENQYSTTDEESLTHIVPKIFQLFFPDAFPKKFFRVNTGKKISNYFDSAGSKIQTKHILEHQN